MSVVEPAMITLHFKPLNLSFEVCSFWLRDHCRCSLCYSDMAQRKTNLLDIPLDIEPTELKTENDTVSITCKCIKFVEKNICDGKTYRLFQGLMVMNPITTFVICTISCIRHRI